MPDHAVTRTVETDLDPDRIIKVLSDPALMPQWAPVFADRVESNPEGGWHVIKSGDRFSLQVVVDPVSRTVDYLREIAPGKRGGAYIRVLPGPTAGSVVVMTLPVPRGGDSEQVVAILVQELAALVSLTKRM
jgi:hypothetical protein